ncbi:hypothetical protein [Cellulomonas xylanilytica]|uniref:Uncharacterized protein n=1 Tax=Cellulomonas xylanilytica TaxID=233583 RepID=A0A510VD71_9CELL|nr:hypothetical protein [Cellulomonas xylanilytica]GEK23095.1 hypothetical protein CXY01_36150 [Cellulomonas xylanilytica]
MRELADLMNDALAERSGSLADLPTAQVGDRLHRKVRFRRARRHTLEAGGATAAVAVLGATTWFGVNRGDDPAPAISPTMSATPSPTQSPTPTPTPSPTPTAVADDILGLPPTYAMPAGLLEQTTPGWVLSIYRSGTFVEGGDEEPVMSSVLLSSPEGTLYRVVDLAVDPLTTVNLSHWVAGSSTAVVNVFSPDAPTARAILDLATGTITDDGRGLSRSAFYVGQDASGAEVWTQPAPAGGENDLLTVDRDGDARLVATLSGAGGEGNLFLLDPTGTRAAFSTWLDASTGGEPGLGIVDLGTGDVRVNAFEAGGRLCTVVGWSDANTLLTGCSDDDTRNATTGLWDVDVSSDPFTMTLLRELGPDDKSPQVWSDAWISDGILASPGYSTRFGDGCPDGVYTWSSGVPTILMTFPTDSYAHATSVDGRVYVTAMSGCDNESAEVLTALGPSGPVVMAPAPAPRPDGLEWTAGMTSWVAAR